MSHFHLESHRTHRIGWLRAAVLGANDGLISTASLVLGVLAGGASSSQALLAAVAGLVAGAMSMAAGEYVSVQSQADTEKADLDREIRELREEPEKELLELTHIYRKRGLNEDLALEVAKQLTAADALAAHMRDELGITESLRARPLQAAFASAAAFFVGGFIPVVSILLTHTETATFWTFGLTLTSLFFLGAMAAYAGGASIWKGSLRVAFWGVFAMSLTMLIGKIFGTAL